MKYLNTDDNPTFHLIYEKPKFLNNTTENIQLLNIGQCDACSPTISAIPNEFICLPLELDDYYILNPIIKREIKSTGYYTILSGSTPGIAVMNTNAVLALEKFKTPKKLNEILNSNTLRLREKKAIHKFLLNVMDLNLLIPAKQNSKIYSSNSKSLSIWLHITNRCNMRCRYCYIAKDNADMNMVTAKKAIDKMISSAIDNGFSSLNIKYAGGEPLLRFDFIEIIHEYAIRKSELKGLKLTGKIITNGTLIDNRILNSINKLNLSITVSVDGLNSLNETNRKLSNNQSSFPIIKKALMKALAIDIPPTVNITITEKSAYGLSHFVNWLLELNIFFSFNFERKVNNSKPIIYNKYNQQILQGVLKAYRTIENNMPQYSLLFSITDRVCLGYSHNKPCEAGYSYLAIHIDGYISKCQMNRNENISHIDADDPLKDITPPYAIHDVRKNFLCSRCEWNLWCAGGCPLDQVNINNDNLSISQYCYIYKQLIPEVLEIEGLRLLENEKLTSAC